MRHPLEEAHRLAPTVIDLTSQGDQMPLENHHVFFELTAGLSLPETMRQLRLWFEINDIRPIAFSDATNPSGSIELQLTFGTRHEASLFEQAFCQIDQA